MSMIDTAIAFVNTVAAASLSSTIVYERNAEFITLSAIIDESRQLDPSYLGQVPGLIDMLNPNPLDTDQPFNFAVADLVLGTERIVPQKGDRITATIGGVEGWYEVMAPPIGSDWEWLNARTRIRVHTKFVGEVEL
jgi:hypothetical protein